MDLGSSKSSWWQVAAHEVPHQRPFHWLGMHVTAPIKDTMLTHPPGKLILGFGHFRPGSRTTAVSGDPRHRGTAGQLEARDEEEKNTSSTDSWPPRRLSRRSGDHGKLQLRDRGGKPELSPSSRLLSHPCSSQKPARSPCQAAASASKPEAGGCPGRHPARLRASSSPRCGSGKRHLWWQEIFGGAELGGSSLTGVSGGPNSEGEAQGEATLHRDSALLKAWKRTINKRLRWFKQQLPCSSLKKGSKKQVQNEG